MRSTTLALVLLLAALAGPAGAAGKPKTADAATEAAKAAFQEGNAYYSLGHFREALGSFEKAYKLKQVQGLLFNIAQCHRQLKQFELAVATYKSFVRLDPGNPQVEKARALIEECDGVIKAQNGALSAPPLDVAGREPGIKPIPVLVPPPPPAPAPGANKAAAVPPLVSGAPLEPAPPLLVAAAPPPSAAQPVAAVPPAKARAAPAPREALAAREAAPGERKRTVTWITAGAAVVALGGGAAFGLMSRSTASSLTGQQHTRAEIDSMQSDLSSQSSKANLLFIAGGVLAVAAGAFFVLHL